MQGLCDPGIFGGCENWHERRPRQAQQRNAGGAKEKSGPDPGGRAGALIGSDHKPQHQQRGCDGRGADDRGEGFKEQHQDGKYAIFLLIYCSEQAACHRRQPTIPGQFTRRSPVRLSDRQDVPQLCIHPFILPRAE